MILKRVEYILTFSLMLSLSHADSIDQKTEGWCSPAVNKTDGNVTINCYSVSPKIVKRLEELLDKKDTDLTNAQQEVDFWLKKYYELKNLLTTRPATDELAAKAKTLLDDGDLKGAEELLKKSLAQNLAKRAQLLKEKESLDQAAAKDAYDLGLINELQLDYVAVRSYFEQAASITPKNTLYLNQAGLINHILANYKKAIGYYELALSIDLKIFGEDHPRVATDRNNLGGAWDSLGEYQKAIAYYEQALSSDLKTVGEEHPNVARDRNNLGSAWKALGEYQKAIKYFELALSSNLKTFGEDHPRVATDRNNLGGAWYSLGEYQTAIAYYEQALSSDLKTVGEKHPDVAIDRNNLGAAWKLLGETQKAIGYYELALSSDLKTVGEEHPAVAIDRNNLGGAWYSLGEYQKAIGYYEMALVTMEKRLPNHPNTKSLRNNLALTKEKLAKSATQ